MAHLLIAIMRKCEPPCQVPDRGRTAADRSPGSLIAAPARSGAALASSTACRRSECHPSRAANAICSEHGRARSKTRQSCGSSWLRQCSFLHTIWRKRYKRPSAPPSALATPGPPGRVLIGDALVSSVLPDQVRRRTAALSIGLIGFVRQEKFVTKLRQRDLYVKNLAVSLQVDSFA